MNQSSRLKILFISSLYPSSVQPDLARYNRQLIGALAVRAEVRVVAPVFWFPLSGLLRRHVPPLAEEIDGIKVSHPRVFHTPGIFVHKHWLFYKHAVRKHLMEVISEFKPDHVMIGFAYPDGAAVGPLCRELGINYSIRINGSDFRIRVRQKKFRELVLKTLNEAPLIFCPGQALKRDMIAEGIEGSKIVSFSNGVDTGKFHLREKEEAWREMEERVPADLPATAGKRRLSQIKDRKIVLFVGNLVHVKGVDLLLKAFALLVSGKGQAASDTPIPTLVRRSLSAGGYPHTPILLIIGDGKLRWRLERQAERLGIADSVVFLGSRPHDEIALRMNVADCLCLPSRSEGMPNAVMEALASGLPVVAANVGEVPFLVKNDVNGFIVEQGGKRQGVSGRREEKESKGVREYGSMGEELEHDLPERLAEVIRKALNRNWDREQIASRMKSYTWESAANVVISAIAGKINDNK